MVTSNLCSRWLLEIYNEDKNLLHDPPLFLPVFEANDLLAWMSSLRQLVRQQWFMLAISFLKIPSHHRVSVSSLTICGLEDGGDEVQVPCTTYKYRTAHYSNPGNS
jgi:hypothetical protein